MSSNLAHAQHQARAWAGRVSAAVLAKAAAAPDDRAPPDAPPSASNDSDRASSRSSRSSASTVESDGFYRLPAVASTGGRYTHIGVPTTRERSSSKQSGAAQSGAAELGASVGSTSSLGSSSLGGSSLGSSAYTGQLEPGCRTPGSSDRQLVSQPPSEELPPSDSPAHGTERPADAGASSAG